VPVLTPRQVYRLLDEDARKAIRSIRNAQGQSFDQNGNVLALLSVASVLENYSRENESATIASLDGPPTRLPVAGISILMRDAIAGRLMRWAEEANLPDEPKRTKRGRPKHPWWTRERDRFLYFTYRQYAHLGKKSIKLTRIDAIKKWSEEIKSLDETNTITIQQLIRNWGYNAFPKVGGVEFDVPDDRAIDNRVKHLRKNPPLEIEDEIDILDL